MIKELTDEFVMIKDQFVKEKERTVAEEKKNKLLREEIDRTNKLLRAKTLKYILSKLIEWTSWPNKNRTWKRTYKVTKW